MQPEAPDRFAVVSPGNPGVTISLPSFKTLLPSSSSPHVLGSGMLECNMAVEYFQKSGNAPKATHTSSFLQRNDMGRRLYWLRWPALRQGYLTNVKGQGGKRLASLRSLSALSPPSKRTASPKAYTLLYPKDSPSLAAREETHARTQARTGLEA